MDSNELTIIGLILTVIFGIISAIPTYYTIKDHRKENQSPTTKEERSLDTKDHMRNGNTDYYKELTNSWNFITVIMACLSISSAILTILSFFGVQRASDVLYSIYVIMNLYGDLNVNIRILIWSTINLGFTFYVYKYLKKATTEYSLKIRDLTLKVNALSNQLSLGLSNTEDSLKIKDLTLQVDALRKELGELPGIQREIQREIELKKQRENEKKVGGVADEIFKILKKYIEIPINPKYHFVYTPYLKIIVDLEKNIENVVIPVDAVREIKKLECKSDVTIEYAPNVKLASDVKAPINVVKEPIVNV